MARQPEVERVRVDGPSGPFEVHPRLVEKFPDRFVPAKKTTAKKAETPAGEKEAN